MCFRKPDEKELFRNVVSNPPSSNPVGDDEYGEPVLVDVRDDTDSPALGVKPHPSPSPKLRSDSSCNLVGGGIVRPPAPTPSEIIYIGEWRSYTTSPDPMHVKKQTRDSDVDRQSVHADTSSPPKVARKRWMNPFSSKRMN